jgi:hypothetical protein
VIKRGDRFVDPVDGVPVTVVGPGSQPQRTWWRIQRDGESGCDHDVAEHYLQSWQRLPDQPPLSAEEPPGEPREALDKVGKIITDLLDTPVVHRGAFEAACGLVRRALAEREPSLRALIAADLAALERDNKRA